jgi:hypothetical protein
MGRGPRRSPSRAYVLGREKARASIPFQNLLDGDHAKANERSSGATCEPGGARGRRLASILPSTKQLLDLYLCPIGQSLNGDDAIRRNLRWLVTHARTLCRAGSEMTSASQFLGRRLQRTRVIVFSMEDPGAP